MAAATTEPTVFLEPIPHFIISLFHPSLLLPHSTHSIHPPPNPVFPLSLTYLLTMEDPDDKAGPQGSPAMACSATAAF